MSKVNVTTLPGVNQAAEEAAFEAQQRERVIPQEQSTDLNVPTAEVAPTPGATLVSDSIGAVINNEMEEVMPTAPRTMGAGQGQVAQMAGGRPAPDTFVASEGPQIPTSELNRDLYDAEGNPLTPAQKLEQKQKDIDATEKAMKRPGAVDLTKQSELSAGFDGIIRESDQGKIQVAANNVVNGLTEIDSNGQTNLAKSQQLLFEDDKDTVTGITGAMSAIGLEMIGDRQYSDEGGSVQAEPEGELTDLLDFDDGIKQADEEYSGVEPAEFERRMGKYMSDYKRNQLASMGYDPNQMPPVDLQTLGQIGAKAATHNSLYFKEVDGKIYPTDKGREFIRAAKDLQAATVREAKGLQSKSPANKNTGWYDTALKSIRKSEIKRHSPDGNKRGRPRDIVDYQASHGSVGLASTTNQMGGAALFLALALNGDPDAANLADIGAKRQEKVRSKAKGDPDRQWNRELANTLNKAIMSFGTWGEIQASGETQYNYVKADPTVWRLYPENMGAEIQNNLFSRWMTNSNMSYPINVNADSLKNLANSATFPEQSKKYFLRQVSNPGPIENQDMRLVSNLVLAHKNIEGGKTENMTWEEKVRQSLDLGWITAQAKIGKDLQSAIAKTGIIGSDGKVNLQQLENMLPPTNAKGKVMVDFENNNAPVTQNKFQLPEFTPDERQAIQTVMSKADKKTLGFVISSYLGMADLGDSIMQNKPWNAKITGEMDMNSAGRAFTNSDIGDQGVLMGTGIIWEPYATAADVIPVDARQQFTQVVKDTVKNDRSLTGLFNRSNAAGTIGEKQDLAAVLSRAMDKVSQENPGFDKDFAKGVLLTDDYGMPAMMHQDAAASILRNDKYSAIKEALMPYYATETDMVQDIAQVYERSLISSGSSWQKALPKNMTDFLGFFNRAPAPTLMFGEKAHLGSEVANKVSEEMEMRELPNGQVIASPTIEKKYDPLARGKSKAIWDWNTQSWTNFTPQPGTVAKNAIGPMMGQYRESATLIHTDKLVNGDRDQTPLFWQSVHDNMVVNGNGFAKFFFAANKANGGAASTALDFNMIDAFLGDFKNQSPEILQEIKQKAANKDTFDIGRDGDNALIAARADYIYEVLQGKHHGSQVDQQAKDYYNDMLKVYRAMGWTPESSSQGSFQIPAENMLKKVEVTLNGEKKSLPAIQAWLGLTGLARGIDKFNKTEAARKAAADARRGQELMYFMT